MDKLWSFSSRSGDIVDIGSQQWEEEKDKLHEQLDDLIPLPQVLEEVVCFLNNAKTTNSISREEIPNCVVVLHKSLESMMDKYNRGRRGRRSRFGQDLNDDNLFLDAVDRILKLSTTMSLSGFFLDKTSSALEKAMFILENDLCAILHHPKSKTSRPTPPPVKSSSFGSLELQFDLQDERESLRSNNLVDEDDKDGNLLPTFSTEELFVMNKIATAMNYRTLF